MRRKLFMAATVVILAALVVANRLMVAAAEERLDASFSEALESSDLPFQIDYDELPVGATMTSFYLEGLTVLGPDESFVLICYIARFDIPISQLWKLRQADTPEELSAISLAGLFLSDVTMILPREEASLLAIG